MAINISPNGGNISALLFENKHIGLPVTLFLSMSIDLIETEFLGQAENTCIKLDFIKIKFYSFLDLENTSFHFPVNPDDGYIDGSIYLDDQHIPVDVTKINFGVFNGDKIQAQIIGNILYGYSGYKEVDQGLSLDVTLKFDNVIIHPDILPPNAQNLDHASKLLAKFFDVSELSKPVIENNGFRDAIVFYKSV